jgi:hypothetical protein
VPPFVGTSGGLVESLTQAIRVATSEGRLEVARELTRSLASVLGESPTSGVGGVKQNAERSTTTPGGPDSST